MAETKKTPDTAALMIEQATQEIAQMKMDAQREIDARHTKAEENEKKAEKILENAKLVAANIPVAKERKSLDRELSEAAKLTLQARMEKQFGAENMTNIVIPFDNDSRATTTMDVIVNGWAYQFKRGVGYTVPQAMLPLIMGSIYTEDEMLSTMRM